MIWNLLWSHNSQQHQATLTSCHQPHLLKQSSSINIEIHQTFKNGNVENWLNCRVNLLFAPFHHVLGPGLPILHLVTTSVVPITTPPLTPATTMIIVRDRINNFPLSSHWGERNKSMNWSVYADSINQLCDLTGINHLVVPLNPLLQQLAQVGKPPHVLGRHLLHTVGQLFITNLLVQDQGSSPVRSLMRWRLLPVVVLMSLPTRCTRIDTSRDGFSISDFKNVTYLAKISLLTWLMPHDSSVSTI